MKAQAIFHTNLHLDICLKLCGICNHSDLCLLPHIRTAFGAFFYKYTACFWPECTLQAFVTDVSECSFVFIMLPNSCWTISHSGVLNIAQLIIFLFGAGTETVPSHFSTQHLLKNTDQDILKCKHKLANSLWGTNSVIERLCF